MQTELLLVVIAKALTELAALFLAGRGLLYVLAGRRRAENIFYQLFSILTNPVLSAVRWITPRVIIDRHIPLVAVVLLFWIWVVLVILKARFGGGA